MYKIYKIVNNINNKVYIGATKQTLKMRFKSHLVDKRKGKNTSALYNAIKKYSDANWEIKLIEDNISEKDIDQREQFYIKQYNSYKKGYNCSLGGRILKGLNHPSTNQVKYEFINKYSGIKEVLTMTEFCEKYNLEKTRVSKFILGHHRELTDWYFKERGFRFLNGKKVDKVQKYKTKFVPKVYILYHDIYGHFSGTLSDFKKSFPNFFDFSKTKTNSNNRFYGLVLGTASNVKGWRITPIKHTRDVSGINNPNYKDGRYVKTTQNYTTTI